MLDGIHEKAPVESGFKARINIQCLGAPPANTSLDSMIVLFGSPQFASQSDAVAVPGVLSRLLRSDS